MMLLGLLALACETPETQDTQVCVTDAVFFEEEVAPVLSDCVGCHLEGGVASEARYALAVGTDEDTLAANRAALEAFILDTEDGAELLLDKPSGQISHAGGLRMDRSDPAYAALHEFVARTQDPGGCAHPGTPLPTCDGSELQGAPIAPRRLTDAQLRNAARDLFGVDPGPGVFPPSVRGKDFRTFASANPVSGPDAEQLMLAAETVAELVDVDALLGGCATDACAHDWVLEAAERAYRRPLTQKEQQIATRFVDAGLSVDEGVRMSIMLLLQSPQFLYLDAVPEDSGVLDDHAIAARLAFFLTDTLPDETLREAAAAGELHTREQVAAQAARLVQDPRALRAVENFHDDWLDGYRMDGAERDASYYPHFSEATLASMQAEMDLMVTEVLWGGEATFANLMFSQTTWVDSELAAIYDLPDPGPGWHRVELGPERPGVLTRAGFLTGHAYTASSSPVQRGAFVLQEMLCEELVPPQDVNMDLPPESEEAETIRERLAQHAADPACASCHDRMDPIGFAFENFDAVGSWRDDWESGIPVDATGSLADPAGDFDGAAEMLGSVATSERAMRCYAQRWYEYGQGRPVDDADLCSLSAVQARFEASGGDIRALMVDIAVSDAFRAQIPSETAQEAE